MLTDRLHILSAALQHVEDRLDQLEQNQAGTLDLHTRCTLLYAKQEAVWQRLAVLDGELSQVLVHRLDLTVA